MEIFLNLRLAPGGFQLGFPTAGIPAASCDPGMFEGKQVILSEQRTWLHMAAASGKWTKQEK